MQAANHQPAVPPARPCGSYPLDARDARVWLAAALAEDGGGVSEPGKSVRPTRVWFQAMPPTRYEELPLVRGGQGRTDAEVKHAAFVWSMCLTWAILGVVAVVVWLAVTAQ